MYIFIGAITASCYTWINQMEISNSNWSDRWICSAYPRLLYHNDVVIVIYSKCKRHSWQWMGELDKVYNWSHRLQYIEISMFVVSYMLDASYLPDNYIDVINKSLKIDRNINVISFKFILFLIKWEGAIKEGGSWAFS